MMSTKEWAYKNQQGYGLYQELSFDPNNSNPAVIEVRNPVASSICYEINLAGGPIGRLTTDIPADIFDEIAVACCRKRKLHGAGWSCGTGMRKSGLELKSNKESNTLMSC
jgi:hypothetical protein